MVNREELSKKFFKVRVIWYLDPGIRWALGITTGSRISVTLLLRNNIILETLRWSPFRVTSQFILIQARPPLPYDALASRTISSQLPINEGVVMET